MHIHNKICEKREKDRKKGEEREGCERHESGSPAKMARESKVLTLSCVAGILPLLFQPQRHNSPLGPAT